MLKRTLLILGVLMLASAILFISIFNSSAIKYPSSNLGEQTENCFDVPEIDYVLPHAGKILPDSPFWKLKAIRDRIWFSATASQTRRAELALLFADKRLVMSRVLYERGEYDVAISTFTKAEKYLLVAAEQEKKARDQGLNTDDFLVRLAKSSLKHTETAEELMQFVPEDVKPFILKTEVYARETYKTARDALYSRGIVPPKDPFNRD